MPLARQIEAGAPADIYVSAHRAWMDYLDERGLLVSDTRRRFAGNRLVVVAAAGTSAVAGSLTDLPRWLGAGGRLAVGDPDHVPAGMYARAALRSAGLWTALEPRLARADSVRAALALVTTGSAPVALVYATDLGADAGRRSGLRVLATVDPALHPPIVYEIARLARPGPGRVAAGDAARRTGSTAAARQATVDAAWQALTTAPARAALARLGFATE